MQSSWNSQSPLSFIIPSLHSSILPVLSFVALQSVKTVVPVNAYQDLVCADICSDGLNANDGLNFEIVFFNRCDLRVSFLCVYACVYESTINYQGTLRYYDNNVKQICRGAMVQARVIVSLKPLHNDALVNSVICTRFQTHGCSTCLSSSLTIICQLL